VHRWDLLFEHAPGRDGAADAVGVCTGMFTEFGPARQPILGRDFRSCASTALYANGNMYARRIVSVCVCVFCVVCMCVRACVMCVRGV
jgi:hypothetical protein